MSSANLGDHGANFLYYDHIMRRTSTGGIDHLETMMFATESEFKLGHMSSRTKKSNAFLLRVLNLFTARGFMLTSDASRSLALAHKSISLSGIPYPLFVQIGRITGVCMAYRSEIAGEHEKLFISLDSKLDADTLKKRRGLINRLEGSKISGLSWADSNTIGSISPTYIRMLMQTNRHAKLIVSELLELSHQTVDSVVAELV